MKTSLFIKTLLLGSSIFFASVSSADTYTLEVPSRHGNHNLIPDKTERQTYYLDLKENQDELETIMAFTKQYSELMAGLKYTKGEYKYPLVYAIPGKEADNLANEIKLSLKRVKDREELNQASMNDKKLRKLFNASQKEYNQTLYGNILPAYSAYMKVFFDDYMARHAKSETVKYNPDFITIKKTTEQYVVIVDTPEGTGDQFAAANYYFADSRRIEAHFQKQDSFIATDPATKAQYVRHSYSDKSYTITTQRYAAHGGATGIVDIFKNIHANNYYYLNQ